MVHVDDHFATCEAHSYRVAHEVKWRVQTSTDVTSYQIGGTEVTAMGELLQDSNHHTFDGTRSRSSTLSAMKNGPQTSLHVHQNMHGSRRLRSSCFVGCYKGEYSSCASNYACTGCDAALVCPRLCKACSGGNYGGLPCNCPDARIEVK